MTSKIKVDNITDQDDNNIINESGDVITVGAAGDTVAVAGNIVKSNALQASDGGNIVNQSGTTITIGASGDTVSLASGASQSGFGRAGSVDWQTGSIKTSDFTASSGEGYFVNTSGGAVTMTLPSSPSAGDIVGVKDYALSFDSNALTINRNGEPINGGDVLNPSVGDVGASIILVYVDSTKGWIPTVDDTSSLKGDTNFMLATGGTVTEDGNCKVHTFTGPGTFAITAIGPLSPSKVEYRVVAGGGGGGKNGGGGGGAGGHRTNFPTPSGLCVSASPGSFPITVGAGGAGSSGGPGVPPASDARGVSGNNSIFSSITSAGGGGGGNGHIGSPATAVSKAGKDGGSGGGGGSAQPPPTTGSGGNGNSPAVSPPQGNNGGNGQHDSGVSVHGGGGGGAGGTGGNAASAETGQGGNGVANSIPGSPVTLGGGGSGGPFPSSAGPKAGGPGGGGAGGGTAGTTNTGGGGGGGVYTSGAGGTGGSGVVVIRYRFK